MLFFYFSPMQRTFSSLAAACLRLTGFMRARLSIFHWTAGSRAAFQGKARLLGHTWQKGDQQAHLFSKGVGFH